MSSRHRSQLFKDFERWAWNEKGYGPRTRETYFIHAQTANRWLEDPANGRGPHKNGVSICWAGYKDLQAYLWTCSVNPNTRNCARQALIAFGEFLIFADYTDTNPAKSLARLPIPRALPKAYDKEVMKRVMAVAKTLDLQIYAAVSLLLYTGIRRAELLNLEWRFFEPDLKNPRVWLRFKAKGNKDRNLPIHPIQDGELVKLLNRWKRECPDARWVFPSPSTRRQGKPISVSTLQKWMDLVEEGAGVHLTPHLFRHTCATMLLDSGVDVRVVKEWLGHESLATTQVYTKVFPVSLEEAAGKMNLESLRKEEPA